MNLRLPAPPEGHEPAHFHPYLGQITIILALLSLGITVMGNAWGYFNTEAKTSVAHEVRISADEARIATVEATITADRIERLRWQEHVNDQLGSIAMALGQLNGIAQRTPTLPPRSGQPADSR